MVTSIHPGMKQVKTWPFSARVLLAYLLMKIHVVP